VLAGLGKGISTPPAVAFCPRHYGISTYQRYVPWRDGDRQTVVDDFNGLHMVPGQVIYLVRKNDVILPGKPVVRRFGLNCRMFDRQFTQGYTIRETFVTSTLDDPPSDIASFSETDSKWCFFCCA
jgi:hypothetical protein